MNERSTFTPRQRQLVPLQPIPIDKKPYLVRGLSDTLLYLTPAQAASRMDLIPQFGPLPIGNAPIAADRVKSERW